MGGGGGNSNQVLCVNIQRKKKKKKQRVLHSWRGGKRKVPDKGKKSYAKKKKKMRGEG